MAGLGPGEVSCPFPQPGEGSGAASAHANGWQGPGHRDRTPFPVLVSGGCRSLLRTRAADAKGNKVEPKPKQEG